MKPGMILALVAAAGIAAQASNYELLVKAIRKLTDDITVVKAKTLENASEIEDLQEAIGTLVKKGGGGTGSAALAARVDAMEAELRKNREELARYWKKAIDQRRAILEEAKRAAKAPGGVTDVSGAPVAWPTKADKADIQAIREYLSR